MTQKVGRNDPCPCGSGKKYKNCCMHHDEQVKAQRLAEEAQSQASRSGKPPRGQPTLEGASTANPDDPMGRLAAIRQNIQAMLPLATPEKAQELRQMLARLEESVSYVAAQDEVEAANKEMDPHYNEYAEYVADEQRAMELAQRLFAEAPFRPLWFSAEDVQRAFAEVGQPRPRSHELKDHEVDLVVKAIVYLARDRAWRTLMGQRLLRIMVDYARAGRHLEAWMVQYSAYLTVEKPEISNPFLFEMFNHGFLKWSAQLKDEQAGLFAVLGLDPDAVKSMLPEQVSSLVQAASADPAKSEAIQAYFAEHSEFTKKGKSDVLSVGRAALSVLARRDAQRFLLPAPAMAPYVSAAMEESMPVIAAVEQGRDDLDHDQFLEVLGQALLKQAQAVARDTFTPERVAQLADDLKMYAQELQDVGDQDDALQIRAAQLLLKSESPVDSNPFLVGLGYLSLRVAVLALEGQAQPPAGDAG